MLSFRHALRGFTWSQVAQRPAIENNSKIERASFVLGSVL